MAVNFFSNIDLFGNELRSAALEATSTEPTAHLSTGRIYYDTGNNVIKVYNGTSFEAVGITYSLSVAAGAANTSVITLEGSDDNDTTVTVSGTTNEIAVTESGSTITIGLPDDVTIQGNLTVLGDTVTLDTQTVTIEDNMILINSNQSGTPLDSTDGGIEVERGDSANVKLYWDEGEDLWASERIAGTPEYIVGITDVTSKAQYVPVFADSASGQIQKSELYINSTGLYYNVSADSSHSAIIKAQDDGNTSLLRLQSADGTNNLDFVVPDDSADTKITSTLDITIDSDELILDQASGITVKNTADTSAPQILIDGQDDQQNAFIKLAMNYDQSTENDTTNVEYGVNYIKLEGYSYPDTDPLISGEDSHFIISPADVYDAANNSDGVTKRPHLYIGNQPASQLRRPGNPTTFEDWLEVNVYSTNGLYVNDQKVLTEAKSGKSYKIYNGAGSIIGITEHTAGKDFTLNHAMGTNNLVIQVFDENGNTVFCDTTRTDADNVRVTLSEDIGAIGAQLDNFYTVLLSYVDQS